MSHETLTLTFSNRDNRDKKDISCFVNPVALSRLPPFYDPLNIETPLQIEVPPLKSPSMKTLYTPYFFISSSKIFCLVFALTRLEIVRSSILILYNSSTFRTISNLVGILRFSLTSSLIALHN